MKRTAVLDVVEQTTQDIQLKTVETGGELIGPGAHERVEALFQKAEKRYQEAIQSEKAEDILKQAYHALKRFLDENNSFAPKTLLEELQTLKKEEFIALCDILKKRTIRYCRLKMLKYVAALCISTILCVLFVKMGGGLPVGLSIVAMIVSFAFLLTHRFSSAYAFIKTYSRVKQHGLEQRFADVTQEMPCEEKEKRTSVDF